MLENCQISQEEIENDIVTLKNKAGLVLVLSKVGASVYGVYLDNQLLTLQPKVYDEFVNSPQYFGKTLGLIAGRYKKNVILNKKEVVLHPDNLEEKFVLHGGERESFSFRRFSVVDDLKTDLFCSFKLEEENVLGIKGLHTLFVDYILEENENKFSIRFRYVSSKSESIVNLSNHIYWNFNQDNILKCKLKIKSKEIGVTDESLFLIDKTEVSYPLDFRKKTSLKKVIDQIKSSQKGTIDDTYLFSKSKKLKLLASLENSNYKLDVSSTYSAMNVYLNNVTKLVELNNINKKLKFTGLAFEPQNFILDDKQTHVKKNKEYSSLIQYTITKKK